MTYLGCMTQFSKMLGNLSLMLDKAEHLATEKKFDVEILLQSRLAPDQFNFTRQVQITCDTAKFCAALLADKTPPAHPDTEKTVGELKSRIEQTIGYLNSFSDDDFRNASEQKIYRPKWEGKYLLGEHFLLEHALPNFYFHLTTAYSILRHNGVSLGKKDYLGKINYRS